MPFLPTPIWNCVDKNKRLLPVFRNFVSKGFEGPSNSVLGSNYLKGRNVLFAGSVKRGKADAVSADDSKTPIVKDRFESLKIISRSLYFLGKGADESLVNHSEAIELTEEELKRLKGFNSIFKLGIDESEKFKTSSELSNLSIEELRLEFEDVFSRFYRIQLNRFITSVPDYYPYPILYIQNMMDELNAGKFLLQLDRVLRKEGVIALRPTSKEFLSLVGQVERFQQLLIDSPKKS